MALRTCVVSYCDRDCKRSVEVLAETLHEAAVLGIAALELPRDTLHLISVDVAIKAPVVYRSITGAGLCAWLSQPGKDENESALKTRLGRILHDRPG